MIIAIIETTNVSPHLETTLEIAKNHLDSGDTVHYSFIGDSLEFSDFIYPPTGRHTPQDLGLHLIRHENLVVHNCTAHSKIAGIALPNFRSEAQLREFRVAQYNAGEGAYNSLVQLRRTDDIDFEEEQCTLRSIITSGIFAYIYSLELLERIKPDLVYVFNGRFASNSAIKAAAIKLGITTRVHERGGHLSRYSLTDGNLHCIKTFSELIRDRTSAIPTEKLVSEGESFFNSKKNRVEFDYASFTTGQTLGRGIELDKNKKKLITYFTSSNYEFVGVNSLEYFGGLASQHDVIQGLIQIVKKYPNWHLAIRVHPNETCKSSIRKYKWLEHQRHIHFLYPQDPTDTYELIKQSDVVVSCGSTVGIEAVYWGTPSISLASSAYDGIQAVYKPRNLMELEALLKNSEDLRADKFAALRFGFFMNSFGEPWKYYTPINYARGRFLGVDLSLANWIKRSPPAELKDEAPSAIDSIQ